MCKGRNVTAKYKVEKKERSLKAVKESIGKEEEE